VVITTNKEEVVCMATINKDQGPQGPRSYNYHSSGNFDPNGTIQVVNVTPSDKRITGNSESAKAQRDSIARQYDTDLGRQAVA
jgi:hypothetical protein